MLLLVCSVLALSAARAQDLDPSLIQDVFGKPPANGGTIVASRLDEMVRPTTSVATFTDGDGDSCQCVPYYLCDTDLNAARVNDPTITGFGKLDIRFGERENCQESVERCCKIPKINKDIPLLEPDSSRLKGCGYRNPRGLDFSITVNDNEAQFGEFPWVMALLDPKNHTYYGVGVLIHPQVVMTAAHIAYEFGAGQLKIRAGEWDTQTDKERLRSQERLVVQVLVHEAFNKKNLRNDVALLRLESPVDLADHINVICLPNQDESFDNYKNCVANGWGKNLFGRQGRYAVILKRIELNMVDNPTCNDRLQHTRLGQRFQLHKTFVCAGGEAGKDTCQGDGGAPLACPVPGQGDRYKLSGLVAWGIGCGQEGVPAVYARVASFRHWVDNAMAGWGYDTAGSNI